MNKLIHVRLHNIPIDIASQEWNPESNSVETTVFDKSMVTIVKDNLGWSDIYLSEVFKIRELIKTLTKKEIVLQKTPLLDGLYIDGKKKERSIYNKDVVYCSSERC